MYRILGNKFLRRPHRTGHYFSSTFFARFLLVYVQNILWDYLPPAFRKALCRKIKNNIFPRLGCTVRRTVKRQSTNLTSMPLALTSMPLALTSKLLSLTSDLLVS